MSGILIIDASKAQLKLEKEALINEGYEIYGEACSIQEGKDLFFGGKPDLVIIDSDFPENEVLEIIESIKYNKDTTLVIIIVEEKKMSLVIRAVKHGADEFITKPVDIRELIYKVKKIYR